MIALSPPDVLASTDRSEPASIVPGVRTKPAQDLSLSAVTTLVLWLGCTAIGGVGLLLPYERPQPPRAAPLPVVFEKLQVELAHAPAPTPDLAPPAFNPVAPPPAAPLAQPQISQPIAVAEPTPAIAFAVPVDRPARIVDAAHAGYSRRAASDSAIAAQPVPVQSLVFGEGEGRQPAPHYPARASRLGQEGTVTVQFSVDESGRVVSAEASQPSPWPLLNEAAVRTVRERWRFAAGAFRSFEVAIVFRLKK